MIQLLYSLQPTQLIFKLRNNFEIAIVTPNTNAFIGQFT